MEAKRIDEAPEETRALEATRQLLAWLILAFRPPTTESVTRLLSTDLLVVMEESGVEWGSLRDLPTVQLLHSASDPDRLVAEVVDEIETEYVRLFVNHPSGRVAHPEALAWLAQEGPEAQSEYSLRLGGFLDQLGFARSSTAEEPPDHLTVLLELLYSVDHGEAPDLQNHPVVRDLLVAWLPRFLDRLAGLDPPPLYSWAAGVLAALFVPEAATGPSADEAESREP